MQATANIPAKIAPTNHPIAIRRLVNFYLFYLNKAVHFNYFLIFLASFLSFSIFIWIAAATNARSFRSSPRYSCGHLYFNPRTRVGCDPLVRLPDPPGGYFNPRTRVGCDWILSEIILAIDHFNPRTRVGCDHLNFCSCHPRCNFNPRTRVGCDTCAIPHSQISRPFQSTHPGGVRQPGPCLYGRKSSISIHAPAWGATDRPRALVIITQAISIHAPAWGATRAFPA